MVTSDVRPRSIFLGAAILVASLGAAFLSPTHPVGLAAVFLLGAICLVIAALRISKGRPAAFEAVGWLALTLAAAVSLYTALTVGEADGAASTDWSIPLTVAGAGLILAAGTAAKREKRM